MDNRFFIMLLLLIIASAAVVYWQLVLRPTPEPLAIGSKAPIYESAPPPESLGAQIYVHTKDPIENKIPEVPPAAVNPIEGAYKNPFE